MSFANVVRGAQLNAQGNCFHGQNRVLNIERAAPPVFPAPQCGGLGQQVISLIAIESVVVEDYENDPDPIGHAQNFLDCSKSRRKLVDGIETGFNPTPTLLALVAVREGRTYGWEAKSG